jgi:hypothetical protein
LRAQSLGRLATTVNATMRAVLSEILLDQRVGRAAESCTLPGTLGEAQKQPGIFSPH